MNRAPVISVVIPVRNGAATIRESIASVLAQSYADFEIVVIDDGSTDHTTSEVASVRDPRVRVAGFPQGGLAAARNRGIDHARGEFISFLDADDLWTPCKLESQLRALRQNPAAGAAYSWTTFVDENTRYLFSKERTPYEGDVYERLLLTNFIASGSNVMLRRACMDDVGGFDMSVRGGNDDWEYWIRFARRWPFALVREYQVLYRYTRASISTNVELVEDGLFDVVDRAFAAAPPELLGHKRASMAWSWQYIAFLYLARSPASDAVARARRGLRCSIRCWPRILLQRKTLCLLLACLTLCVLPRGAHPRAMRVLMKSYGRVSSAAMNLRRPVRGSAKRAVEPGTAP